jgi:hypothetical protein
VVSDPKRVALNWAPPPPGPETGGSRAFDGPDRRRTTAPGKPAQHGRASQGRSQRPCDASNGSAYIVASCGDTTLPGDLPSCPIPQGQTPHPHPQLATTALPLNEKTRYQVELTPSARNLSHHPCRPSGKREEITHRYRDGKTATTRPRQGAQSPHSLARRDHRRVRKMNHLETLTDSPQCA